MKWSPTAGMPAARFNELNEKLAVTRVTIARAQAAFARDPMAEATARVRALAREPDVMTVAIERVRASAKEAAERDERWAAYAAHVSAALSQGREGGAPGVGAFAPCAPSDIVRGGLAPSRRAGDAPPIFEDTLGRIGEELRTLARRIEQIDRVAAAPPKDELISSGDAAKYFGVSKAAIDKQIRRRRLEILMGGRVFVRRADLDKIYPRTSKLSAQMSDLATRAGGEKAAC